MKLKLQFNKSGYISVKKNSNETYGDADNVAWFPDFEGHQKLEKEEGLPIAEELVKPLETFVKLNNLTDTVTVESFVGLGAKEAHTGKHSDQPLVVRGLSVGDVVNFLLFLADGDQVGVWLGKKGVEVDALTRSTTARLIKTFWENTTNVTFKGRSN